MKTFYVVGLGVMFALTAHVAVAETSSDARVVEFSAAEATHDTEKSVVCTADYTPVCGEIKVQCITTPCNPVQETFSNLCNLEARGAKFLHKGECRADGSTHSTSEVGGDGEDIGAPSKSPVSNIGSSGDDGVSIEREMKESGEKGGTADINIGVGELQGDDPHKEWIIIHSTSGGETRMNKADLIDAIAKESDGGVRSGFLKIGDIKGESDGSANTDGDTNLDSDTAAKTSKPKEIVVVGSKVRQDSVPRLIQATGGEARAIDSFFDIWVEAADPTEAAAPDSFFDIFVDAGEERSAPDSFFDIFVDVSDADVQLHAVSIAQSDESIQEVRVLENEVQVVYDEKLKLFGVIPIQARKTVIVDATTETERVKVRFPWWHFLATKTTNVNDLTQAIEEELDGSLPVIPHPIRVQGEAAADDRPTEEVSFYYNKIQAQTLRVISNVTK